VNQKYVIFVPKMPHGKQVNLPFQMIYDDAGNFIPTTSLRLKLNKLEALMNGKMYDIPVRLAD
jgi:hypothetical protein